MISLEARVELWVPAEDCRKQLAEVFPRSKQATILMLCPHRAMWRFT